MPRRPARPVSWVYSPGVMSAWVSPFHFDQLLDARPMRAGMLMPERQRLGREDDLDQAAGEQLLDDLLEGRQHAGVVGGDAARQRLEQVVVAEHVRGPRRGGRRTPPRRTPRISSRSSAAWSAAGRRCRHCCTAASQPARLKMNMIAGSSPSASSRSTTSARLGTPAAAAGRRRGRRAARRRSRGPARPRGPVVAGDPHQLAG